MARPIVQPPSRRFRPRARFALALAVLGALTPGCAAVTNPVANGIPARLLPPELLAQSREGYEQLPLTLLRQQPPEVYTLAPGDTLGVYIDGILGSSETPAPVAIPDTADLPPSVGYPIPVRSDGSINLPLVGSIDVEGLSVEDAERRVIQAYTTPRENAEGGQDEGILREGSQILVSLLRPRYVRVLVVREDSPQQQVSFRNESLLGFGSSQTIIGGGGNQGIGQVLELPAYQNDVLNALARTGGLPGLESTQEVIIQRGYWDASSDPSAAVALLHPPCDPALPRAEIALAADPSRRTTRIPLRIRPGQPLNFTPRDVILESGDIIFVRGRDPEFFYTGGLLPSNEFPMPVNYDLHVVEAILKARGPLLSGGINTTNFITSVVPSGIGTPSPSLLSVIRQTPNGGSVVIRVDLDEAVRDPRENILVQAGDVLILQETPDQALTRYFTTIFRLELFTRYLNRQDAQGSASIAVP